MEQFNRADPSTERIDPSALRHFRRARGWQQADLAAHTGVSAQYVSKIELGTRKGRNPKIINKFAEALGVEPEQLLAR